MGREGSTRIAGRLGSTITLVALVVGLGAVPAQAAEVLASTTGFELTEGDPGAPGAATSYEVRFDSGPIADITVRVTAPSTHVTVSPSTLVFTSATWSTPQTVTVAPVNDHAPESTQSVIVHHHTTSADPNFQGLDRHIVATIVDDDYPALVDLSHTGAGTTVTEGGSADVYLMRLTARPTANVTVAITPLGDVSVGATSVTFTPENFNSFVGVPVTAVNDAHIEVTQSVLIRHSASSGDPRYDGTEMFNPSEDLAVTVLDNDRTPQILIPTGEPCLSSSGVRFAGLAGRGQPLTVLVDGDAEALTTVADDETWSVTAPIVDGHHIAVAKDGDGRVSPPVEFTVDTVAPTAPVILTPAAGALVGATVAVSGTADPGATIVLTDGAGAQVGSATAAPDGTWSAEVTYATSGPQTLIASTTDCAVTATSSAVEFTVDTAGPALTIDTSGAPQVSPGDALFVEGSASDPAGVRDITVSIVNTITGRSTAADVTCPGCPSPGVDWDAVSDELPGRYTIVATATDALGNQTTKELTILKL